MKIKVSESMKKVTQPEGIYKLLVEYFKSQDGIDRKKEHFFVIHLDARNRVKFLELVSIGILNASLVHPREVFCRAVVNVHRKSFLRIITHQEMLNLQMKTW